MYYMIRNTDLLLRRVFQTFENTIFGSISSCAVTHLDVLEAAQNIQEIMTDAIR
jgi:hypothetical protein